MSPQQWLALAAMACLPFTAAAQQKQPGPSPMESNAPAAAFHYESAFKNYQVFNDEHESPDKVWRSANDEMDKAGGHAGGMKDGAQQAGTQTQTQTPAPAPAPASGNAAKAGLPTSPEPGSTAPARQAPTDHGTHH